MAMFKYLYLGIKYCLNPAFNVGFLLKLDLSLNNKSFVNVSLILFFMFILDSKL